MDRLLNAMKAQALALDRAQGQARFALVTSVDPQRYAARVSMQPEGVLTGWLPILTAWMGAGWGMVCPPRPGDQVLVLALEGDAENGVIVGASFSDRSRAPAASPGELWLVHASGAAIRLTNEGAVRVSGDLHVDGDVYDRAGSLARLRAHYDAHEHFGGGGTTTQPD
jgi:phage baseplate assembly protein V